MDFPIPIKAIRIGLSLIYFKGSQFGIFRIMMYFDIFCACLTNIVDPDEMQHHAAFHLALILHCLPKYPLRGFQYTNYGLKNRSCLLF